MALNHQTSGAKGLQLLCHAKSFNDSGEGTAMRSPRLGPELISLAQLYHSCSMSNCSALEGEVNFSQSKVYHFNLDEVLFCVLGIHVFHISTHYI